MSVFGLVVAHCLGRQLSSVPMTPTSLVAAGLCSTVSVSSEVLVRLVKPVARSGTSSSLHCFVR